MDYYLAEPCDAVPRLPADLVQAPLHALLQVPTGSSLLYGLNSGILVDPDPGIRTGKGGTKTTCFMKIQ
jgi:hypothetical protein